MLLWLKCLSPDVEMPVSVLHPATFTLPGVKIIFRVGLVLLKHTLGSSEELKTCQGQYETVERLRALNPKIMQETFLVREVKWDCGSGSNLALSSPWNTNAT